MVQAAVFGALDFAKADPLDRKWSKRVAWTTKCLAMMNVARIHEMRAHQNLAACAVPNLASSSYDKYWKGCNDSVTRMINCLLPWIDVKVLTPQEEASKLWERYRRTFGDPNDPAYKAEIQKLIDHWNKT